MRLLTNLIESKDKPHDVEKAREFVKDVIKLSEKYKMSFFFVTEGASAIRNNNNPAVKACRDALVKWESENNGDPDEDWLKK